MTKHVKGMCELCDDGEPSILKASDKNKIEVGEKCYTKLLTKGKEGDWDNDVTKSQLIEKMRKRITHEKETV